MGNSISSATLKRLPTYLNYLKSLPADQITISSSAVAAALNMGDVQVRKDLASVCSSGKPKIGYRVDDLVNALEEFLGYNKTKMAVLVGAGRLGKALLNYGGFKEYGVNIVAGFDADLPERNSVSEGEKTIYSMDSFIHFCIKNDIRIGVITVPGSEAQKICDLMIEAGILAIWNFAPVHLDVPENILVKNENMAYSLIMLSNHLSEQLNTKGKEMKSNIKK